MKTRFLAAAILLSCATVNIATAGRTDEGTWTAGGSVFIDTSTLDGVDIDVDLLLGKYIRTGVMVGGFMAFGDNDLITSVSLGAIGKYHFLDSGRTPLSPFVGADVGVAYSSTVIDDVYALVLGGRVGLDYFLTEGVAIETAINFHVATDDIYTDDEKGLTNTDATFTVGLAFFF